MTKMLARDVVKKLVVMLLCTVAQIVTLCFVIPANLTAQSVKFAVKLNPLRYDNTHRNNSLSHFTA